jgi:acetyl esterase/lipase
VASVGPVDADDVLTRPAALPDAVVRYAAHDDGLLDVHLPAGPTRPRPLVVFLHGGFWRRQWDRRHTRPLAAALAGLGYVVAVPEYRRGAGAWARTAEDVEAALTAAPGLLDGLGVPTTATTLVGHSAGGHLVLWLANQEVDVRRVVALAPVGDLRLAAATGMGDGAAVTFLGGTPEQLPVVYDAADPATRMRTRPPCTVVVVHGDRDDAVPVQSSRGLHRRHGWLDYRELPGVDHSALIDPLSDAWPSVVDAVRG